MKESTAFGMVSAGVLLGHSSHYSPATEAVTVAIGAIFLIFAIYFTLKEIAL